MGYIEHLPTAGFSAGFCQICFMFPATIGATRAEIPKGGNGDGGAGAL